MRSKDLRRIRRLRPGGNVVTRQTQALCDEVVDIRHQLDTFEQDRCASISNERTESEHRQRTLFIKLDDKVNTQRSDTACRFEAMDAKVEAMDAKVNKTMKSVEDSLASIRHDTDSRFQNLSELMETNQTGGSKQEGSVTIDDIVTRMVRLERKSVSSTVAMQSMVEKSLLVVVEQMEKTVETSVNQKLKIHEEKMTEWYDKFQLLLSDMLRIESRLKNADAVSVRRNNRVQSGFRTSSSDEIVN